MIEIKRSPVCARRGPARLLGAALATAALAGCGLTIGEGSFYPASLPAPKGPGFIAPPGVVITEAMLPLPDVAAADGARAVVRVMRLDRPGSDEAIVYHGGNGHFLDAEGMRLGRLSTVTGMDVIAYDYPGRGGTNVPATVAGTLAAGPALLAALRAKGWVPPARGGRTTGPRTVLYGLSFGGSQAAAMARNGGVDGVIIEGSASDIRAIGRDFAPALIRPFLSLKLTPAMRAFDYEGYLVAARAPVLVLAGREDRVIRPRRMARMVAALTARGVDARLVAIPGGHGTALRGEGAIPAAEAIRDFLGATPPR